jgi:hypothetical protein
MKRVEYKLADFSHPTVALLASEIIDRDKSKEENFKSIFHYVRDEILFSFPPKWDYLKASETIKYGVGYCNSKAILMQALCTIANIPIKLKGGLIQTKIMEFIFPKWAFPFLEETSTHMWIEVNLNRKWHPLDSYILDHDFYKGAKAYNINHNQITGCALGYIDTSEHGNWDEGFIQSNAVVKDLGVWEDASLFYNSEHYKPLSFVQKSSFPILRAIANSNIEKIRSKGRVLPDENYRPKAYEILAEF